MTDKPTASPVEPAEVTEIVLQALAEKIGDRLLTWPVAVKGLAVASFEIKRLALHEIARQERAKKEGKA